MKCEELDILLADYFDGELQGNALAAVEQHLAECPNCAELFRDIQAATSFVARVPAVEPPPELVTRIVAETASGRHGSLRPKAAPVRWLERLFEPVLQPRFAMSMALTILSFSMLGRVTGLEVRQLRPADLQPARVWAAVEDKAHRTWDRAVIYYESLRLVYEVQARLSDWGVGQGESADGTAPSEEEERRTASPESAPTVTDQTSRSGAAATRPAAPRKETR